MRLLFLVIHYLCTYYTVGSVELTKFAEYWRLSCNKVILLILQLSSLDFEFMSMSMRGLRARAQCHAAHAHTWCLATPYLLRMGRKGKKKAKLKRAGELIHSLICSVSWLIHFSIALLSAAQSRRAKVKGQRGDAKAKTKGSAAHSYTVDDLLAKVWGRITHSYHSLSHLLPRSISSLGWWVCWQFPGGAGLQVWWESSGDGAWE